jgi:hypothetical protein
VRNQAGQVENFIAIENDITSRVETENQLRRAKAEADFASRAKSEFLASMSHEIRTPDERRHRDDEHPHGDPAHGEQRDFVNTIRTSGEALLTIINDILDFSKIESGKMELEKAPFELALCVEEALDLFAPTAAAKRLEIGYHVEQDVPPWIVGDVTRLADHRQPGQQRHQVHAHGQHLDPGPAGSRWTPRSARPRGPDEARDHGAGHRASASRRTGSTGCSRPSARWTRRRPASTAARASGWRSASAFAS